MTISPRFCHFEPVNSALAPAPQATAQPAGSADDRPVHVVERVRKQLQSLTIGAREVGGGAVDEERFDSGGVQLPDEAFPLLGCHGDGDVMKASESLPVVPEIKTGKVEIRQVVVM